MNQRFAVFVMLLCCVVPVASFGQAAAPKPLRPLEQSLMDAEKSFVAAAKKGDVAYFKRTLTDDFTAIVTTGDMAGKDDFVEGVAGLHGKDLRFYDFKVLPLNENAAVVTYNAVLPGEGARYQHLSNVWVKQGDQWKLKFQQSTPNLWSLGDI